MNLDLPDREDFDLGCVSFATASGVDAPDVTVETIRIASLNDLAPFSRVDQDTLISTTGQIWTLAEVDGELCASRTSSEPYDLGTPTDARDWGLGFGAKGDALNNEPWRTHQPALPGVDGAGPIGVTFSF